MAESAIGRMHVREKVLECPRDHALMEETHVGTAYLDVCGKCGGQYFDSGEMFEAFGIKADPSYWDREETSGNLREGSFHCPRCHATMLTQDITHGSEKVEIDRCRKCGGIWLDKGEVERIMAIGEKMQPVIDAEIAKAKADLTDLPADFRTGLFARFLGMFKKKS